MIEPKRNGEFRIRTSIAKTRHDIQRMVYCNGVGGDPWYMLRTRVLWPMLQATSAAQQIVEHSKLTQR